MAMAYRNDAHFKREMMARVDSAAKKGHPVRPGALLELSEEDHPFAYSNLFSEAFGTIDPEELAERSGLPTPALCAIGAVLATGSTRSMDEDAVEFSVEEAKDGHVRLLDAIKPGANFADFGRQLVLATFADLLAADHPVAVRMKPEIRAILQDVRAAHATDSAPNWRSLRKSAVATSDAASDPIDRVLATFAESVTWPAGDLDSDLPSILEALDNGLRREAQRQLMSDEQRATRDAADRELDIAFSKSREDPETYGKDWIEEQFRTSPVIDAIMSPEWHAAAFLRECEAVRLLGSRGILSMQKLLKGLPHAG